MPIQRKNPITGEMEYINKEKDPNVKIEQLKTENEGLQQQLAQSNADFIALTDALAEKGVL